MAAKAKGLGKGLGTLLGDVADVNRVEKPAAAAAAPEEKQGEKMVKIRLLEPNRNQPRKVFQEEALGELADSIRMYGVIQPLIVQKVGERYRIIAGERRWRAAKLAGLKEVPVIEKEYTDREMAEISLIENIQRADLNPVEEAAAYDKLLTEYGMTQEELAAHLGKSRAGIANAVRLLRLPEDAKTLLAEGKISMGHAKVILGIEDPAQQSAAAAAAAELHMSVRELEAFVKRMGKPVRTVEKVPLKNQVAYEETETRLKELLSTRVKFQRATENSGKIEISYFSLEDLERILDHIR
ncbi:MAG: ParB/RepB/Spo0J family partition protein [Lachnospiraceae bacterium]|nr:ParB/RepB/Spo0J family partition protein [Lachnospiraceae bacterium]